MLGNVRRYATSTTVMLGVLAGLGCNTDHLPTAPARHAVRALAVADSQPFFYSLDGTPIYLTADPEEIVFTSSTLAGATSVAGIAAQMQLAVNGASRLPQLANHWQLHLPKGTSMAAALALRARLRSDGRFGFVSTAYHQVGDSSLVLLVDRAIVHFKAGVTPLQVDSLVTALHMRIVRPPRPDSGFMDYLIGYPVDTSADPLKIAAVLFKHPLVAWAQPDKIGEAQTSSVPTDPYFPLQYYLKNTTLHNGIEAPPI